MIEQARNACQTTIVQDAWARGQELVVHGWYYGLSDGLLQDLQITVADPAQMGEAFERAVAGVHGRYASANRP